MPIRARIPYCPKCRYCLAILSGIACAMTWDPSRGGIGMRLKKASKRLIMMPYSSTRKAKFAIPGGKANADCATTKNVIRTVDIEARMRFETIPARETLISPGTYSR